MAVLTGLAPDPYRAGYRLVTVERGRFASLPEEALTPLRLRVGEELAPELLARLHALADVEAAARAALRAQARRPHARADLRRRLLQKQHPPAAVDVALERLVARGLLDDRRFAEYFAATRAQRGRGPARLLQDLLGQGVARGTAEQAVRVALADEGFDTAAMLARVARRRAAQLGRLPAQVRRRRLLAYLARRGFRGAGARQAVEQLVSAGPP